MRRDVTLLARSRRSAVAVAAAALAAAMSSTNAGAQSASLERARTDTIRVTVHEGTWLAFDRSRDGRQIAFDLLGQLWVMPASGGDARQVTDAVRDSAEDHAPVFAPDGRSLVFAGERSGHPGLWQMELDSRRVRRLTVAPVEDDQPAWSPDGRTIAFVREMGELRDGKAVSGRWLHLLDVATGSVRRVPLGRDSAASVRDPAWSPDGRAVYVVAPRRALPATVVAGPLWAVDVASGARSVVGDSTRDVLAPSPSPDGRTIAYVANDSAGRPQVWLLPLPAGTPRRVTSESELTPRAVRWTSPDTLLVVSGGRLRRVAVATGAAVEIPFAARLVIPRAHAALPARHFPAPGTRSPARGQTGLALSPDGTRAAMIALRRLWIIPIDGGAPRAVGGRLPEGARDVDWSPAQDRAVYAAGSWGAEDLHVMELATGRDVQLTALPGREVVPRWSPDGRWISFLRIAADSEPHLVVLPADARGPADMSRARDLGQVAGGEWVVGIESAGAPTWSPDSRALFAWRHANSPIVREPFAALRPGTAEVIPLEGARRAVAGLPLDPTWVRWTNDTTLVYVEADRVMGARLRGDSITVSPGAALGDDAALYLSAARDGALLYVSGDGLRWRSAAGAVRRLGWPVTFTVARPAPLLVRNVRVLDGTGAPATGPRDVLLRGGRVARIGAPGSLRAAGARTLDGAGGVLMPGLSDLHSHQDGPEQLRGALYNGVTFIRDQGSDIATVAARADESLSGEGDFPHQTYGGFQVYTDWAWSNGIEQGLEPERDAGHAARIVGLLVALGAEHMKIRTGRGWSGNARLVALAHRAGLRTTGHCIFPLPLIAAGMDSKEHGGHTCLERDNAPLHDDVLQVLKRSGAAVIPTTVVYEWERLWLADTGFLRRPDVAPFTVAIKRTLEPWTSKNDSTYWIHEQGRIMLDHARALHDAGVPLGVGCDAPLLPWGPHRELERLVAAGLTPLEAIRAATLESARIAGHDAELGSVAPGKLADLVLLEPGAEPWRDVHDTRRIRAVILGGRLVDRDALRRQATTTSAR
ncbi:MAG TPA: amidohydrolase family protein [Gemmatimonadaceae bacterium]|nr:amidohydrolase family protein [Gemmatimonadaceae bacterium]